MTDRYRRRRRSSLPIIIISIILVICAAAVITLLKKINAEPEPDPHEGQVYIYDGFDWVWMTPLEGVPVNTMTQSMFAQNGSRIDYVGSDYDVLRGIDVSEHQRKIDWKEVARADIDFAYIRVGRRGYTEGGIYEDEYFTQNIKDAISIGLKTGVYFFSQAVTVQEAIEEANFVLDRIGPYRIDLPVVFDWEKIDEEGARTADLSVNTRTDCAVAFCETIKRGGYEPCVYFNRNIGYYGYDLTRLTDYRFWFSLPESPFPNFYYACDIWQYSFTESVRGIEGGTDMSLMFIRHNDISGETSNSK